MTRYKIIANPRAGSGTGARRLPLVKQLLAQQGLDFNIVLTEQPGHATKLTEAAAVAGYDVVVAAGGDGTSNEVINGLMVAQQAGVTVPAMGVLCVGRGNDFAHAIGIPADLDAACQTLGANHRRWVDVGRVVGGLYPHGRYFGNCVGVGFDAIGTIEAAKLPRLGGFLSFFIAVLKTIFLYHKAPTVAVEYDGKTLTQPSLMVSIMNGTRLGGGFIMAPEATPDDGVFDLCMARAVSRARIFTLVPHFLRGTQASQPPITMGKAARIAITAVEGVLPAQTDGEILCIDGQRLDIELLPRRLEVVCTVPEGGG